MSYVTETSKVNVQDINRGFIRKVEENAKLASDQATAFVRTKMREESIAAKILVPEMIGPEDLDRSETTDAPIKIVEKEPDSKATYVTFKGMGPRRWITAPRFAVKFGKVESERFVKSKFELMTYQNDVRQIISDNSVKDMAAEIDGNFYDTCVACVNGVADQDYTIAGPLSATVVSAMLKSHIARKTGPVGTFLMTKELFYDIIKLTAANVGDQIAAKLYEDGAEDQAKLWGVPVVTTIKNDIVPNDEIWLYSPQSYVGKYFMLQDATMFIETKADLINFWSYMAPGIGIGNTRSITRYTLT